MKKAYKIAIFTLAIILLLQFLLLFIYLISKAFVAFDLSLIKGQLLYPIAGSALVITISTLIVVPLGIATAIYLNSYAKGKFKKFIDYSFDALAATPSILIGLFGFSIILSLHNIFPNFRGGVITASSLLAMLSLPYIVKATKLGFSETLQHHINIAFALGATKEQVIKHILLPSAKKHILKGVALSIARSSEDTAVIMLTGVVASYGLPSSLFEPFEALPFFIYTTTATYSSQSELNAIFIASAILILLSTSAMAIANLLKGNIWLK